MNAIKSMLITLLISASAFANVADVEPSKASLSASNILSAVLVQANQGDTARISLVKVDNGGSTDIGALMGQASLYVGIHLDGEMFNVDGSYLVSGSINAIKSAKLDKKSSILTVVVSRKNEQLKSYDSTLTIYLADALKEAATATSEDFVNYELKSTIGVADSSTGQ